MKLLIIDDHAVLRDGLAALLKHAEPNTVIIEARNAQEGISKAELETDLDLIILDLSMPGIPGFEALSLLGLRRPDVPVIVLSSSEAPKDVRKALASGALGYVPKSATQHVLLSAIKLVMNGELYVPPLVLDNNDGNTQFNKTPNVNSDLLTARQIDVLKLICVGDPNKIIARKLGLSEKTVKTHVTAIFKSLNVENRTQATNAARLAGFI